METSQKIDPVLRAALEATPEELAESTELSTGLQSTGQIWEVIVKYTGSLENLKEQFPDADAVTLLSGYAILKLPQSQIEQVAQLPEITYMEKPKRLFFEVQNGKRASCISSLPLAGSASLTGAGIFVAVIDSGIDYSHPDFRLADGSSRIAFLWDQTIRPDSSRGWNPPEGYSLGTLFTREMINEALSQPTPAQMQQICPSIDLSGHGTHVAGIACGNGNASDGVYRGVAYEADLIVVKLGTPDPLGFPSTSQLMEAVNFCVQCSILYNKPAAINLSFGNTYGSHSGTSLLETFLDTAAQTALVSIAAGSGNEGASGGHTGGILDAYSSYRVEFAISDYQQSTSIQIWKNYWDEIRFLVSPPSGSSSIAIPSSPGAWRFTLDSTQLFVYYGEPSPYNIFQEIWIDFLPVNSYLDPGIWSIQLQGQDIRDGIWDMWMPAATVRNAATQFLLPTPEITLTIPSTATRVITVGAYDSNFLSHAAFSGRGYTWNRDLVKPDLVAPGVDITSCAPGGGYVSRTGTSMATPFVTGSCALLMQWGILAGNDPYLYGDKLKAYLIRGAKRLPYANTYPNPETGWGALCLRDSFPVTARP